MTFPSSYFLYFIIFLKLNISIKTKSKRGGMFGKNNDPLQEALSHRSSNSLYRMAQTHSNFFKKEKFDLEYFGMSFSQRIISFAICLILGVMFFFTSFYRLVTRFIISPTAFVPPYVLSNIMFFVMYGFITGFKTYFRSLLKKGKRKFTITFFVTTFLTMYSAFLMRRWYMTLAFGIVQIFSFVAFFITFLPGGAAGLTSLLNMVIKG